MDWTNVVKQLVGLGLPILGTALGGPLGATVATIIAKALGVEATPAAVETALQQDTAVAIQKLKSAEAEYVATVQAEAAVAQVQVPAVNAAIQAELTRTSTVDGWLGKFLVFMQVSWRPVFAYETIFECMGLAVIAMHETWTGDFQTLKAMMEFQGFLQWYFGIKFGLLGVYSWGRTKEKVEGNAPEATANSGGLIDNLINKIRGARGGQ